MLIVSIVPPWLHMVLWC